MKTTPLLSPADLRAHAERLESMDPSETLKPAAEADRWRAAAAAWEAEKRDQPTPDQTPDRIAEMARHIVATGYGNLAVVPEHVRDMCRGHNRWPFPEAWPTVTWSEFVESLDALSSALAQRTQALQETRDLMAPFWSYSPEGRAHLAKVDTALADPSSSSESKD